MRRGDARDWAIALLLLGAVVPWFFGDDVARLVVRQRPVLLGRYGVGRFAALALVVTPLCLLAAWRLRRPAWRRPREEVFRVVAILLGLGVGLTVVEVAGRALREQHYRRVATAPGEQWPRIGAGLALTVRAPDKRHQLHVEDVPRHARGYPRKPPAWPPADVAFTTDARGYRNPPGVERCDVLAVGDSFVEGIFVSDDQTWPHLLGQALAGPVVYNLGTAGAHPRSYRDALARVVDELKPRLAIVMIYQENDFLAYSHLDGEQARAPSLSHRLRQFDRKSVVVQGVRRALTRFLGPIGAERHIPDLDALSWMPVGIPAHGARRWYLIRPGRLLRTTPPPERFERSAAWQDTAAVLGEIHALCTGAGVDLLLAWAPTKSQVMLPLLLDQVSPEPLRRFLAYAASELPDATTLVEELRAHAGTQEDAVRRFCEAEGIPFVSPTRALREGMRRGEQVYFTYDQHWTPRGQEVVERVLREPVAEMLLRRPH